MDVADRVVDLPDRFVAPVHQPRAHRDTAPPDKIAIHLPESTYRLQFHRGFTFRDARKIAGYLSSLGISDCYASPYLKASAGSMHGYDIIDHNVLNPELGGEDDYNAFVAALHAHPMGQILDVVPNH